MRGMKTMKLLFALLLAPAVAVAATELKLDRAPDKTHDNAALQRGAKLFVNYCLNCHGASFMRYNRLQDIGLTDQQIQDNLLFTAEKVGEPMTVAMRPAEAKEWFGAVPPDLTVVARSRASEFGSGADYLYTYLRSFYRDDQRPTGWNNTVFPAVGMPHALWELQGEQIAHVTKEKNSDGQEAVHTTIQLGKPGKLTADQYDDAVADLVSFLVYMGEPVAETRKRIGVIVMIALGILFGLSYALKKNFWKDIH
jgi:ubiquinol-cytochrome c reductase cytochrome c1 subunit